MKLSPTTSVSSRRSPGWLALCLWLASCGGRSYPDGHDCVASSECANGLCYTNQCLAPAGDSDQDGLSNAAEHALHSHPLQADSDDDGKPDSVEVGADKQHPLDSDADGKPDVVESLLIDSDGDCLADERDARDSIADATPAELASLACATEGVCHAKPAIATCKAGVLHCDYAQVPGWAGAEPCDGLDNDCDGQTDEGFSYGGHAVGQPCTGVGACGAGTVQCQGGQAVCSSNPGGGKSAAGPELCDGLDDDCDGLTDEGFSVGGLPVGSPCLGVGECGLGTVVCGGDTAQCSSNPGGPGSGAQPEACNGRDDDCDGQTDEGIALKGLPLGAECVALGACGSGLVVCGSQGEPVCSSAPGSPSSAASPELCNGLDDNCNGVIDEGFDLAGVALGGACPGKGICGPGLVACNKAGSTTCSTWGDGPNSLASVEACNGLDDDCDGQTDESFHWQGLDLGAACEGTGVCGAGMVECSQDATAATCSTHPDGTTSQATTEQCNSLDDDCDGQTDEGVALLEALACPATGVCLTAKPQTICVGGQWTCDFTTAPGFQKQETACDGLDNDCDGQTDVGLPQVWTGPFAAGDGRPEARSEAAMCAGNAGLLVAGGRIATLGPAQQVLSGELWRQDLASGLWKRLADDPLLKRRLAAAVYLPAGVVATGAQLWLIGGLDVLATPAPALSYDFLTGKTSPLAWAAPPQPRLDPTLVLLGKSLWLLGGGEPNGPVAQRLQLGGDGWTANVPQPPFALGHVAACATPNGELHALGTGASGPWYSTLADGVSWQPRTSPPGVTVATARLVCDAIPPGFIWLVGAQYLNGKPAPVLHFEVATGLWSTADDAAWPAILAPAVAALPSGGVAVAMGVAADGQPQNRTFVGLPGAWTEVDVAPDPVVGARWVTLAGDLYRLGGASLRGTTADFSGPSWRLHAGKWQPLAYPANVTGRAFAAVAIEPNETGVLMWSGLGKATLTTTLLATEPQSASPGALRLDTASGTWTVVSGTLLSVLPPVQTDSPWARSTQPGVTWLFSKGQDANAAELWRIDLGTPSKQLWWQTAAGPGPAYHPGSSLLFDAGANRLVLAQVSSGVMQLWTFALVNPSGWQLAVLEPGAGSARAALFAGSGKIGLAILTHPPGGPKAVIRKVLLDASVTLEAPTADAPAWWGPVSGTWQTEPARLLLDGRLDAAGAPRPGLEQWLLSCP